MIRLIVDESHEGKPGKARKLIDEQPTVGGWISVKDRMPPAGKVLLVARKYKEPGKKEQVPVYVNANGRTALIKRGEYVRVHPSIADVLKLNEKRREVADEYATRVAE
jgi:hypothetical protein